MFDKLRNYLDKVFYRSKIDVGYYVISTLYLISQIGLFIIFGVLFNNWYFIIIGTLVSNIINNYSYTHHCHKLEHCIIMTQLFFIIFGYLAKTISVEWSFLFAILSVKEIYLKAPLKLTCENKPRDWYLYKIICLLIIFLIIAIVLFYFNFQMISNNILWAIIMTNILMMENKLERV